MADASWVIPGSFTPRRNTWGVMGYQKIQKAFPFIFRMLSTAHAFINH